MTKPSFVLQALKILGLEEILKLSEVLNVKIPLKKAAGEELIVWDEESAPVEAKKALAVEPAKILEFPKKRIQDLGPALEPDAPEAEDENCPHLLSSDLILWQREIARGQDDTSHKKEAFNGYRKSTEMYVVKESSLEGKDKIRFASTNGVLINKKQA